MENNEIITPLQALQAVGKTRVDWLKGDEIALRTVMLCCVNLETQLLKQPKLSNIIFALLKEWCYDYKETKTSKEKDKEKMEKISQFLKLKVNE